MKPRDSREKSLPYKSKKLKALRLAVQRLFLICPADEAKKLLDDVENEAPGQTIALLNGKTNMVGPRSDSALWLKVLPRS